MSRRARKQKPVASRRLEKSPNPPADGKTALPTWAYALIAVCFLVGISGGIFLRRETGTTPPADARKSTQPPTRVEDPASQAAPPSPSGSTSTPTDVARDAGPVYPAPADLAEQKRIENRFGVLFRRGYENYLGERYAAAAEDFQKAVETAPYLAEGHYLLGQVYIKMSLDELAEQSYRQALRQMPDFEPAQKELCKLLHEQGAYEQANAILLEMQQRMPEDSFILGEMAINYMGLGQPQEAIPLLQRYNQLMSQQGWGHAQLGRAYELSGDTKNARQHFQQAIEIDPYLAMTYHWYGLLLAREGDETESRELLARYDRLRKLQTVEHDLNMALLRNANDVQTLVRLAQVRRELGRPQEALATLKRARQLAPNNADLARLWNQWSAAGASSSPPD